MELSPLNILTLSLDEVFAYLDGEPNLLASKFSLVCRQWQQAVQARLRHRKVLCIEIRDLCRRGRYSYDDYDVLNKVVKSLIRYVKHYKHGTRYLVFTCAQRSLLHKSFCTSTPPYWMSLRKFFFPLFSVFGGPKCQLQTVIFSHLSTTVDDLINCITILPLQIRIILHNAAVAPLNKFQKYCRDPLGNDAVLEDFHCINHNYLDRERLRQLLQEKSDHPYLQNLTAVFRRSS
ncbi:hypothetical protein RvY_08292 [Ramazzottius varieornatus]|uniref:Uncharacterized protein n=1 Tax=Ramazzottius varieornatus TaxID=947166 RepID=A0A1D1V822_RAMVA|nr:hypothetical protein RvY_08292 [Ramazzottius varieornatus]